MNAVPLDFIQRVVNLLSYDDFYNSCGGFYYSQRNPENNELCAELDSRERHTSAFSRLSPPWPQVVASRPRDCKVNVCGDMYSIHEMMDIESRTYRQFYVLSEVEILTWNRRTHVVRELNFKPFGICSCQHVNGRPSCQRRLSADVFRRLRNILRRNPLPVTVANKPGYNDKDSKFEENLDQLLPAIHGIGLLEVAHHLEDFVPRLLEKPVNFFDAYEILRGETGFVAEHMVEAMKKGLLRGWRLSTSPFLTYSYKKLLQAVVDVHGDRPPRSLWYDLDSPTVDQEEVRLAVENWKLLLGPGYHSISDRAHWLRYIC
uniref:Uncharacterized protein n=1 Tax=Steinernema glaseri TaxID=37863 RepID=A0A1I7Z8P6_9BILA